MLRGIMSSFIATLQIFLLLPALPLAMLSHRTPRARRSRHGGFLAAASLLALGAAMGALVSLSLVLGGDDAVDPLLSFVTPLLTLGACGFVLRRGMMAPPSRRHRQA
jgi:hypothetical protein